MRSIRLSLLALVAVAALVATSVALAAKPGDWQDTKHGLAFGVAANGKRLTYIDWKCKDETLAKGFKSGKGPKIRRHGKFAFKTKALPFKNGGPGKPRRIEVSGRFKKKHGKTRAVGTLSTKGCRNVKFRAKWKAGIGQQQG